MAVSLTTIDNGIHDTLQTELTANNSDIQWVHNLDDLKEGLANTPCIQVYWNSLEPVSEGSATDRRTFGGNASAAPIRTKRFVWSVDLYLNPRSMIDQILTKMLPYVDEINDILEAQNQKPYFGITGIQSYTWSAQRGTQEYASTMYPVCQWTIEILVF
jgi:hypothetical protein